MYNSVYHTCIYIDVYHTCIIVFTIPEQLIAVVIVDCSWTTVVSTGIVVGSGVTVHSSLILLIIHMAVVELETLIYRGSYGIE